MAAAARSLGRLDAAARLADLVLKVAAIERQALTGSRPAKNR
jgi:hypothetical protein